MSALRNTLLRKMQCNTDNASRSVEVCQPRRRKSTMCATYNYRRVKAMWLCTVPSLPTHVLGEDKAQPVKHCYGKVPPPAAKSDCGDLVTIVYRMTMHESRTGATCCQWFVFLFASLE